MKVVNLESFDKNVSSVITIGMFDGVHLGHKRILDSMISIAKKEKLQSVLLTFDPHPRQYFDPTSDFYFITSFDEKVKLLEKTGLDVLCVIPFNASIANLGAEDFIQSILIDKLNLKTLLMGYDHRIGRNREGDFETLKLLSHKYHFRLEQIEVVKEKTLNISSTKIRNALFDGNIELANRLLGYQFMLRGRVVKGKMEGNKLGFPTANVEVNTLQLIPKKGAYVVSVGYKNNFYKGMLNIGKQPTFNHNKIQIEVHILDFHNNIYGENIEVFFITYLREERAFKTTDALKEQLLKDKRKVELYFSKA